MKATVTWDGDSWVAVLEGGGVTQARELEHMIAWLPDLAKLMTGETLDMDEIEVHVDYSSASPGSGNVGAPDAPPIMLGAGVSAGVGHLPRVGEESGRGSD